MQALEHIFKICWKLDLAPNMQPDLHGVFSTFSQWIPNSPEIFVDVADYAHVNDGPLVYLSGHHVDYALDLTDGVYGLLYRRKQPIAGNLAERLQATLTDFLNRSKQFLASDVLPGIALDKSAITLILNDRALAPNNQATTHAITPILEQALAAVGFKLSSIEVVSIKDSRRRWESRIILG
jgi:hypothetical protein